MPTTTARREGFLARRRRQTREARNVAVEPDNARLVREIRRGIAASDRAARKRPSLLQIIKVETAKRIIARENVIHAKLTNNEKRMIGTQVKKELREQPKRRHKFDISK